MSGPRVQVAIVGEDPDEDNRARRPRADPKTSPAVDVQPNACATTMPRPVATTLCAIAPGTATRQTATSSSMKLQPDAEHQQDDADFGELLGHVAIRHEARRVWAHEEPGNQIPDDGGEPDAVGGIAEHQRRAEATSQRKDEIDLIASIDHSFNGFRVQGSGFRVQEFKVEP